MDDLEKIKNIIIEEVNPVKIILFGSRARGDYREDSDYDLMVLVNTPYKDGHVTDSIYRSLFRNRVRCSTDVIVSSPTRFSELSSDIGLVYNTIKEEGKVIYESV
jgi:predicted nucleotidyltransferase